MSFADTLKGMVAKKPTADPRRSSQPLAGGRRAGESDNPYLTARRTWNDLIRSQAAARRMWQLIAIIALLIVLAAIGGIIQIGSQSKFIPYVIEVDKLGQVAASGPVQSAAPVDERVLKATVSEFISDARLVTPDIAVQRKAIFRVYARLSSSDPATPKMNDYLNGDPEKTPFARAATEMVSIEIRSVLLQTPDTWQVDWVETTRDRKGLITGKTNMRALVTVYRADIDEQTEEQIWMNPLSIFIRNYSWSPLL